MPAPRSRTFRPTQSTVFLALILLAAVLSLVPGRYTDSLKNIAQPLLAPLSRATHFISLIATDQLAGLDDPPVSAQEHQQLKNDFAALQNEHASALAQFHRNQRLLEKLAIISTHLGEIRPIVANVISFDGTPHRDIMKIDKGSESGLKVGDWVVATTARSREGRLPGVCLVGRVIKPIGPLVSWVRLLSDPGSRVEAEFVTDQSARQAALCVLEGLGNGRIIAHMVPAEYALNAGILAVARVGGQPGLVPPVAARIERISPDLRNPTLTDVRMRPELDPHRLAEVFVLPAIGK